MICPRCQKQFANVRVTEIKNFVAPGHPENEVLEHLICEGCAQELNLPHAGVPLQKQATLWRLLMKQRAAQKQAQSPRCPDCGMSLEELRRKGRVGCEKDYEVFREYLDHQLERMHSATAHVGHLPGLGERKPVHSVDELRDALSLAIREEDFERAATLRDEIEAIESGEKARGQKT